jgi:hypothetical protein
MIDCIISKRFHDVIIISCEESSHEVFSPCGELIGSVDISAIPQKEQHKKPIQLSMHFPA